MYTLREIKDRFKNNDPMVIAIMGNSIGCGFRADNSYSPNPYNSEPFGLLAVGIGTDTDNRVTVSGQHDTRVQSWAIQLYELLQSKNPASSIHNVSINGGHMEVHSGSSLNSVDLLQSRELQPDAVILPLQINEALIGGGIYWKSEAVVLINQILDAGWLPILMKENDLYDPAALNRSGFYEIISAVDEIADIYGLGVIDAFTPFKKALDAVDRSWEASELFWDNLHPNQAGHDLLFESVYGWLQLNEVKRVVSKNGSNVKEINTTIKINGEHRSIDSIRVKR
jgi:lysophospholipase L1-like esterase